MSDIQYDSSQNEWSARPLSNVSSWTDYLIAWGIAKDEPQAQLILGGITITAFLIIVFNVWHISSRANSQPSQRYIQENDSLYAPRAH